MVCIVLQPYALGTPEHNIAPELASVTDDSVSSLSSSLSLLTSLMEGLVRMSPWIVSFHGG